MRQKGIAVAAANKSVFSMALGKRAIARLECGVSKPQVSTLCKRAAAKPLEGGFTTKSQTKG
jgi:hypothetical protein